MLYHFSRGLLRNKERGVINKIIICLLIIVLCLVGVCYGNIVFIFPLETYTGETIGVIDDDLCKGHNNILKYNKSGFCGGNKSHGDEIANFLMEIAPNGRVIYYSAEVDGKINSKGILDGLIWMKENNVRYVSISLSGKYYSKDIIQWLQDNRDIICYASYSNYKNSFDFPASYDEVIGVGTKKDKINNKEGVYFRTNKLLIVPTLKYYEGNSFLAPYALLKNLE